MVQLDADVATPSRVDAQCTADLDWIDGAFTTTQDCKHAYVIDSLMCPCQTGGFERWRWRRHVKPQYKRSWVSKLLDLDDMLQFAPATYLNL